MAARSITHDAVCKNLYDENAGTDRFRFGRCSHDEGDQRALRFQLGLRVRPRIALLLAALRGVAVTFGTHAAWFLSIPENSAANPGTFPAMLDLTQENRDALCA
jgi:hypothetical protein